MRSHRAGGRALRALLLLATLPLLLGGRASGAELLVAAAVSLQTPLGESARLYEQRHPGARIALTFGASNALAAQLNAGAPIDLLASASEPIVDTLAASGAVDPDSRVTLARNRLVVVVPDGADGAGIATPQDLLAPGVAKLAVPIAAVPLGGYAREWLRARGLLVELAPRIVPTPHARATLTAVEQRHAEAAIVYATDAQLARGVRVAFEIPDGEQPAIRYVAAVASESHEPELARHFLAYLRSAPGARPFADAGFELP